MSPTTGADVDIIGDVHGHAGKLESLLGLLGYRHRAGAWRHPSRTAIFVGDLIDRGPGQLRTLRLVRDMVEAGSAEVVMGNHELNAIGFATADPSSRGGYLRPRQGDKGAKNTSQHAAFLSELGVDTREHHSWVAWFLSLPLWIERPGFRVVHACWDQRRVDAVAPVLREGARLDPDQLERVFRKGDSISEAVDALLKGPEVRLPNGYSFTDKDGHTRDHIRVQWWRETSTYREAYIGPPGVEIPDLPIPSKDVIAPSDRLTFVGHYWLDPDFPPQPLSPSVACVDYSVAKGGPLAAYRYGGESELSPSYFVSTS